MKTANSKTNTRARTGFLSIEKIRNTIHLKQTAQIPTNHITSLNLTNASQEKENRSSEIEAEIKKAQARTYANALMLR